MQRFLIRHSPFLILFALWLLFFWRYFAPDPYRVVYPDGDFTHQFLIFRDIAYRALAAGRLPLWADCFFAGYPFHADPQSQLFYPPVWISFAILRLLGYGHFPLLALTVEATAHYLLVSVLTFYFLRSEISSLRSSSQISGSPRSPGADNHTTAALLGSITFTYGGYLTGYPPLQTGILETTTWLPLALLLLRRLTEAPTTNNQSRFITTDLRLIALSSLTLAVAFFAGHPQTFLFLVYVSAAYFGYRAFAAGRTLRWTLTRLVAVLGLLGALSSVQLLPQVQFLALSNRPALSFEELAGGFPVGIVVQFFITDPVWSPLYVGIPSLTLAWLAAVLALSTSLQGRRSGIIFWLAVAVVGLLLSFGSNTPFFTLAYYLLPGIRLFRHQERLAFPVSFALATLASFGAAAVFGPLSRRARRTVMMGAGLFLATWGGAAWVAYRPDLADWPGRMTLAIFGLLFAATAIAIRLRGPRPFRYSARFLALGLVVVNLFAAVTPTNGVTPFDPYPYFSILDPIRADSDPFFRVQDDARMQGHFACGYGFKEWGGISPIRLASWAAFEERAPESLRWKLMAVKYLITWRNGAITPEGELPPAERVAEGPSPQGDPTIPAKVYRMFEIPRRAWLVYQIQTVKDADAVYDAIRTPGFDPFATAVLPSASLPASQSMTGEDSPGTGSVIVVEDWPGHLLLAVATDRPALLVISEAYYPGWAATANGEPASLRQVDGYVQAVPVPAGESNVQLDYLPASLKIGTAVSVLALVLCVIVIASYRR